MSERIAQAFSKIQEKIENFINNGQVWTLQNIEHIELKVAKYQPFLPSSYIRLPKHIEDKKAVLNIQNQDLKCFTLYLLAHKLKLTRNEHPYRVSQYEPYEHLNKLGNVKYPVSVNDITTLEKLNDLRINVFLIEDKEICPLYISPREEEDVINFLVIETDDKTHYTLIRDFSRLLADLTHYEGKLFYCYRCLHRFKAERNLKISFCIAKSIRPKELACHRKERTIY